MTLMSAATSSSAPKRTRSAVRRAIGAGGIALVACLTVSGALLYSLSLAEAGNPDLADIIGILTIYAGAMSLAASVGILHSAAFRPGVKLGWASVLGPVSAAIGFLSKGVVQTAADAAGLPRVNLSDFLVGAFVALLSSCVLYLSISRMTSHSLSKRAA